MLKEKKNSIILLFIQLWYQVTKTMDNIGIIWDYELWWESLVKWRGKDAPGKNISTLPEMSWQSGTPLPMDWQGKRRVAVGRSWGLGTRVVNITQTLWSSFNVKWRHRVHLLIWNGAEMRSWQQYPLLTAKGLLAHALEWGRHWFASQGCHLLTLDKLFNHKRG